MSNLAKNIYHVALGIFFLSCSVFVLTMMSSCEKRHIEKNEYYMQEKHNEKYHPERTHTDKWHTE